MGMHKSERAAATSSRTLSGICLAAILALVIATPGALARDLQLRQPKYNVTAAYCHFGRQPYTKDGLTYFAWEDAKDLSKYASMSAGDVEKAVASAKDEILTKWVD